MAKQPIVSVTPGAKEFAEKLLDSPLLENLAARWADEKEYEKIEDYMKPIKPIAESMAIKPTLLRMTKRPFGVVFGLGDREFHVFLNARHAGWKRIK